jgi:hypothetical protein
MTKRTTFVIVRGPRSSMETLVAILFPPRRPTAYEFAITPKYPMTFATREIAQACIDRMLPPELPCRVEENAPGVTCAPLSPT